MFNAGIFQYQQALANMQFQQQAAFIPSGEDRAILNALSVAVIPLLLAVKSHVISHKTGNICMDFIAHMCKANSHCFKIGPCIFPNNDSLHYVNISIMNGLTLMKRFMDKDQKNILHL